MRVVHHDLASNVADQELACELGQCGKLGLNPDGGWVALPDRDVYEAKMQR